MKLTILKDVPILLFSIVNYEELQTKLNSYFLQQPAVLFILSFDSLFIIIIMVYGQHFVTQS